MPERPSLTVPGPVVLVVLDGWGESDRTESNAIAAARTPNWDRLRSECAHGLIHTSGEEVGLPAGQMGNSEVGHLNLGAGRVIYQEYTRVTKAIADGEFFENMELVRAVDAAVSAGKAVHVMGLTSPGGVHSHEDHIHAMLRLAADRGAKDLYAHAILDGRDTPPRSAGPSLEKLDALFEELGTGRTASIVGRYYAMDRDKRWDRIEKAYRLYTEAEAAHRYPDAAAALAAAYERDEGDEFVVPSGVGEPVRIQDGDAVIFMNFRADRARQITRAFVEDGFDGFERRVRPELAAWVCLTEYAADIVAPVAFPPSQPANTLGAYVSSLGLRQLRIAETEKYAHVTFFFNGGEEDPFPGEERILVPSPKVATYDLKPEMSAPEVTDRLVDAVASGDFDLIVCNYANADMVGHTGDFDAAVAAVEALDACIGKLSEAVAVAGGEMLITADHGNAEMMADPSTSQAHTAHTVNPVPLVYQGRKATVLPGGQLSDIAPTLLAIMGIEPPPEMSGHSLLEFQ